MGGRQKKKLRGTIGVLKDEVSLLKAILSLSISARRTTASLRVAVLRTTNRLSSSPPPCHRLAAILSISDGACIGAITDRLHSTRNALVALKCLIALHHVILNGSPPIINRQLSSYPRRNFLNLSNFRDDTDIEMWELSLWVQWYGTVLERYMTTCLVLGSHLSNDTISVEENSDSDLVRAIRALIEMVEEICRPIGSLQCKRNNLVYEILKMVADDYRSTQNQILLRLIEFKNRVDWIDSMESTELIRCLARLEDCRGRLSELFMNRTRNEEFWKSIKLTKMIVEEDSD